MEKTNPGIILQRHGIEVSPDDSRSPSEILQAFIGAGIITLSTEEGVDQQQSAL